MDAKRKIGSKDMEKIGGWRQEEKLWSDGGGVRMKVCRNASYLENGET